MSKPDTWMPLYIGDYLQDTTRLTTEQHGAYLLLIMDYWTNGPLPDDDSSLAQVTRMQPAAWKKCRPVMARFFTIVDGEWCHKRIDEEHSKAVKFVEKQKANGTKGGRPKKSETPTQSGTQKKPMGSFWDNPNHKPNETPSPSPSPTPTPKEEPQTTTVHFAEPSVVVDSCRPPDPIAARAIELTALLRHRGAKLQAADPQVRHWAEQGVTDAQALDALERAQSQRAARSDPSPVNAGYLESILRSSRTSRIGAAASLAERNAAAFDEAKRLIFGEQVHD